MTTRRKARYGLSYFLWKREGVRGVALSNRASDKAATVTAAQQMDAADEVRAWPDGARPLELIHVFYDLLANANAIWASMVNIRAGASWRRPRAAPRPVRGAWKSVDWPRSVRSASAERTRHGPCTPRASRGISGDRAALRIGRRRAPCG